MSGAKLSFPSRARIIGQTPKGPLELRLESTPALAMHEDRPLITEAPAGSLPRDSLRVPVVPTPPPQPLTDELLLEAARDASQHLYIPRYRLGTEQVTGVPHYKARIHQDGEDWLFTVHLDRYPAASLGAAAAGAQPLEEPFHVNLQYDTPVKEGLTRRGIDSEEVARVDSGLRATLRLRGLSDQAGFHEALNNLDRRATLTVERRLEVGVPLPAEKRYLTEKQQLERELALLSDYPIVRIHTQGEGKATLYYLQALPESGRKPFIEIASAGTPFEPQRAPRESSLFIVENLEGRGMPAPGQHYRLRLLGGDLALALTTEQLSVAPVEAPPGPAQRFTMDGTPSTGVRMRNDQHAWRFFRMQFSEATGEREQAFAWRKQRLEELTRQPPLYQVVTLELPDTATPSPLYLPDKLHPYVYGPIGQQPSVRYGLVRVQLDGRVYYQDEGWPQRFFYLPDRYELAPRKEDPSLPWMSIRATQNPDTYEVVYVAQPVVDAARLERDAAGGLLKAANNLASRTVRASDLELAPLLGDEVRFSLMLPTASGWQPREQPTPLPDLNHELHDMVRVDAEGLRSLFDALFTSSAALFRGTFTVKLGAGPRGPWAVERIPFEGTVTRQDRQAVWAAIFDPTVPASLGREVEVSMEPGLLAGGDRAEVLFENGGLVTLTAAQPKQVARLRQPISDFVLRKPDAGDFRYQVTRIRGEERQAGDWRSGTGALLHVRSL